jgi:hypothetical protein
MKKRLTVTVWLLALSACEYYDMRLKVRNDLDRPVCVAIVSNDLSYNEQLNDTQYYINARIAPEEIRSFSKSGKSGWEYFVEHTSDKSIHLLVFDVDTLTKYEDMAYVLETEKFSKITYSKEQLENFEWEVSLRK